MKLQGAALSCSGSRLLAGRVWLALCAQGVGRCPLEGEGPGCGIGLLHRTGSPIARPRIGCGCGACAADEAFGERVN